MAVVGDGNFLLEMVGVSFIMGVWQICENVSLHCWQKGANPLFHEDSSILPTSLFQTLSIPPLACHLQCPPHCSFYCPVSLAEWVIMPNLIEMLFYYIYIYIHTYIHTHTNNMNIHMLSLGTLVLVGP